MTKSSKGTYELALVMPIYNEEECITDVVNAWHDELLRLKIDFKMILLNDGSKDGTKEKLELFEGNPRIVVINKENSGHGPTILKGYHKADDIAEWVFQTDSDNEIKPNYFFDLWRIRDNYDALFGIRTNRRQNIGRKFISLVSRMTIKLFFGSEVTDVNTPYRLIRAPILRQIIDQVPNDTFAPNIIISGALTALNVRICNLPVLHEGRKTGSVTIVKWKLWKAALKSFCQTIKVARKFKA